MSKGRGAMKPNRRKTISLLAGAPAALGTLSAAGMTTPSHAQEARRVATTGQDQPISGLFRQSRSRRGSAV